MTRIARYLGMIGAACGLLGTSGSGIVSAGKPGGYSIRLVQATPKPGTKLTEGQTVSFSIVAKYELQQAETGRILLVFQDEKKRPLFPGTGSTSVEVTRGSGTTTLTKTFKVPGDVRTIELFVPLMPAGLFITEGEVVIKYPVRRAK